jgi:conjugal transfer pilus assembly protein TraV
MRMRPILTLAGSIALSGCSLFHSNINGAFACAAPRGTCAPSMAIDDAALRAIGPGSGDQAEDATLPASVAVAGSAHRIHARKSASSAGETRGVEPQARPALKVVYPAWRGADGKLHERTVTFAPVDMPTPAMPALQPVAVSTFDVRSTTSLLGLAEMAPEVAALALPARGAQSSAGTPWQEGALKVSPVPAAANPMDVIKEQVAQILSSLPKPETFQKPDAPAAKTVASFPPAGN